MSREIWSEIINDARLYDGSPQMFSELIDRFESKYTISKKVNLEKKKRNFALSLQPFQNEYSREMLKEFWQYWCEHSPNAKKLRYEKQSAFDLKLRLARWHKNSKNGTKKGHNISEAKSIADRILSGELS